MDVEGGVWGFMLLSHYLLLRKQFTRTVQDRDSNPDPSEFHAGHRLSMWDCVYFWVHLEHHSRAYHIL